MIRLSRAAGVFLLCASLPSPAYYHFIRYIGPAGSTQSIRERFDLSALPNRTVSFYVADNAAAALSAPEAFPSVLNLVRESCQTWNGVASSQLRVAFGGLFAPGEPQTTPGAEVYFEELDPLTLGVGGPTSRGAVVTNGNGSFVPITRSVVRLNRDLTLWTSPSFAEAFFLTVAHEMGHALGLQHTFTGATMATEVTRATSLGQPLDEDDIAGIASLYPVPGFAERTGTLAGRVLYEDSGEPVHLASVVAIRPTGAAISTLTDRDGRYRIAGLTPGAYLLYIHPLPSSGRVNAGAGDIVLPQDSQDRPVEASAVFDTVFYEDGRTTRDPRLASFVTVAGGETIEGLQFSVRRRATYGFGALTTYSFFGQTAVRPAYLNTAGTGPRTIVAYSRGLAANNTPAAGLQLTFLGGTPIIAPNSVRAYNGEWLALDIQPTSLFGASGSRHLVVSLGDDLYVRPNAVRLVGNDPPVIEEVIPNADQTLTVRGRNLRRGTRFLFDGVAGSIRAYDADAGALLAPPPGLRGQRTALAAVNPDGQTSTFLATAHPSAVNSFVYEAGEPGSLQVVTTSLAAGTESRVEISGLGTNFASGITALGFGSSDLQVRQLWVTGPNRLLANVWVAPAAALGPVNVVAVNGFHILSQPAAVLIRPANPLGISLSAAVVNAAPGQSGVFPGAIVTINGSNLAGASVWIGDQPAEIVAAAATQLTVRVPGNLAVGPSLLRVSSTQDTAVVVVAIEPRPPQIAGVTGAGGETVTSFHAGDLLHVLVTGLTEPPGPVELSRLRITCGGIEHPAIELTAAPDLPGTFRIHLLLSSLVAPGAQVPLTVAVDGRTSNPVNIAVAQ